MWDEQINLNLQDLHLLENLTKDTISYRRHMCVLDFIF